MRTENVGLRRLASSTLAKFLVAGGLSYLVNQAALVVLYERGLTWIPRHVSIFWGDLNLGLLIASALAVELSILVRFVVNDRWTFRSRYVKPFFQRLYQSNLSSFGSPLISLLAINLLTPLFGISYLVSNSIGIALGLAWNWTWSNQVVWRGVPEPVHQT